MARTFIGELILRLKDEMSGEAKNAATKLDTSISAIEKTAARLNNAPMGGKFEQQLHKLGAEAGQIERLRKSYNGLLEDMNKRGLSKADRSLEIANFKNAALTHFGEIRHAWAVNATAMEGRTRMMARRFESIMKPMLAALGGYTGVYMAGVAGREGVIASAKWEREKWRQQTASIPEAEKDKIIESSEKLGGQYPSVGITEIAEMARSARTMMGDTDRALQVLPEMVKGMVALQSAKGTDEAVTQLNNLLRGIDNAGANKNGEIGIQATKDIIAGMIRAAQIENGDIDVGKFFQFARRGKIAVPGLSTEFLANIQPALSQDMTPEGFGTALSSAYQAFVIGASDKASKVNLQNQKDLKIRDENGLVDAELFGRNPYAWVKKILAPALRAKGIDMEDETAISKEIAGLSRNTNATGLFTRMVTQSPQIDRSIEQYQKAMGPESAEEARFKDPFVAYKGFIESLRNLAAAVGEDTMPTIVAGLNALANGINRFQQMWRDGDPMAKVGLAGATALAGFSAWKIGAAVWGLMTAGTNLNAAAVALEAAAVSLGGAGVLKDVPGKAGKLSLLGGLGELAGNLAPWLARFSLPAGAAVAAYKGLDAVPHEGIASALRNNPNLMIDMENQRKYDAQFPGGFEGGMHRAWAGSGPMPGTENQTPALNPYQAALEYMERRQAMESLTKPEKGLDLKHEIAAIVYELMKPTRDRLFAEIPVDKGKQQADQTTTAAVPPSIDLNARAAEEDQRREQMRDLTTPYNPNTPNVSQYFEQPAVEQKPAVVQVEQQPATVISQPAPTEQHVAQAYQQNADTRQAAGVSSNPQVKPEVDTSEIDAAANLAATVGQQIQQALSVSATPQVNNAQLQETLRLVNAIKAGLAGIGAAVQQAHASVSREMNRNFADHGVSP